MFSKFNQSKWNKFSKLMILTVISLLVLAACGKEEEASLSFKDIESDVKVATYSEGEITDKEFDKFKSTLAFSQGMDKSLFDMEGYREYVLEQYVVYKYVADHATEEVKTAAATEGQVQLTLFQDHMEQMGYDFEEITTEYGVSESDVLTFFYLGEVVAGHLDSLISTDELNTEYNNNLADYSTYNVRHVLVANEIKDETGAVTGTRTDEEALKIATEVKAKLDGGESWETVASTYSDDAGSKANGGLYADAKGMDWEENFKQAAYSQTVGEIGEPVKSMFGYHVMLVEKRDTPAFEQLDEKVLEDLRFYLSNDKFSALYDEKVESLNIELNLPPIEAPAAENAETDASEAPATETTP